MGTYLEFKNKWLGKPCEVAGSANAKNQCVDLANAYIREVLGLPIVEWTNAVDFPKKCLPPNYEYIKNSLTAVPLQGDLMIYQSPDGIGHIDIFDNGGTTNFVAFSQNWPVGSVCKLVTHTYTGTYKVIGWLRGKSLQVNSGMTDEQKRILDFIGDRTEGDVREAFGALIDSPNKDKTIQTLQEKVLSLDNFVKELEIRIVALEGELQDKLKLVEDWQSEVETANKSLSVMEEQLMLMTSQKNQYKNWYEKALENQVNKMTGWQLIRFGIKKLFVK